MKKQTLKVILIFLLFSLAFVAGAARCKTPRIVPFATEERFTRWSISPVRMTPLDGHVRSFVSPFTVPPEGGFTTIDTSEKQTI